MIRVYKGIQQIIRRRKKIPQKEPVDREDISEKERFKLKCKRQKGASCSVSGEEGT